MNQIIEKYGDNDYVLAWRKTKKLTKKKRLVNHWRLVKHKKEGIKMDLVNEKMKWTDKGKIVK